MLKGVHQSDRIGEDVLWKKVPMSDTLERVGRITAYPCDEDTEGTRKCEQ